MKSPILGAALIAAIERLPDAVLIADDERRYIHGNPAACQLLGLALDQLIGQHVEDFATTDKNAILAAWSAFLDVGVQTGQLQVARADSAVREVEFSAVAHVRPGMHISFLRDITEQKRAAQALSDSESVANLALAAGRMGSWFWNIKTNSVTWSEGLENVFRLEPGTFGGTYEGFLAVVHPEDREGVRRQIAQAGMTGSDYQSEFRTISPSGEIRWISDRGRVLFDEKGDKTGMVGVSWDSTDAKEAEAGLRLSELRYRSFIEQSPLSVQVFTPDGATVSVNRSWCSLWGADMNHLREYNILKDRQLLERGMMPYVRRAFAGEPQELPPGPYCPPSGIHQGQEIWVRAVMYPVKDDAGRVREVVLIHENVTDIKRQEKERAEQADELARSNAELQRFAYLASHDLKEPLRNVIIFSQLLERRHSSHLEGDATAYLDEIVRSAKRMSEMIEGLLEYSRAGFQRDLVLAEADMRDLLNQALDNLKSSIAQTGAVISVDALPRMRCAPLEIVQLWQNLIGNAVKYSEDQPTIDVSAEESADEWIFSVRDRGIGIAPHLHEQIFGLFKRAHGRDYPGTGLGLAICKATVERHRGRIWVESDEGQGAKFRFTLPK